MMKRKRLLALFDCVGVLSLLLILVFIGVELYDRHIIAQQRALGIPDTSEHIMFWIRLLFASGIGAASMIAAGLLEKKHKL